MTSFAIYGNHGEYRMPHTRGVRHEGEGYGLRAFLVPGQQVHRGQGGNQVTSTQAWFATLSTPELQRMVTSVNRAAAAAAATELALRGETR